jgi:ferrous iron transport protein A
MSRKIKDLTIGEQAVISGYEKGEHTYRERLLSMGLTKGTKITLLKYAPLGDPVEILVRGFKLSLRKREAEVLFLKGGKDE